MAFNCIIVPVASVSCDEIAQVLRKSTFSLLLGVHLGLESEADLDGVPLPNVRYKGVELKACQIRFSRRARRVNLARWLAGKIVHFPEKVTRNELLVMYDNFLHIQDLAGKDENFQKKFGEDLKTLATILKGFRVSSKTSPVEVKKLGAQIEEKLTKFHYQKRNILPQEDIMRSYYSLHPMRQEGTPLKELPQKRRIGKGYTDQGSARDPALDGSPSWQEVASSTVEESSHGEQEAPVPGTDE